ncbi:hypothetical protein DFJ73DRAFT_834045 [Zopfochytrium polystomum]|nr:hypothetical protein DFJ73DRAFT_834045 [Zopfochytrium polystomum]
MAANSNDQAAVGSHKQGSLLSPELKYKGGCLFKSNGGSRGQHGGEHHLEQQKFRDFRSDRSIATLLFVASFTWGYSIPLASAHVTAASNETQEHDLIPLTTQQTPVGRDNSLSPVITFDAKGLPQRRRPPGTESLPTAIFLAPVPTVDPYWAGLVSSLYMQLDILTLELGLMKNIWVDLFAFSTTRAQISADVYKFSTIPNSTLLAMTIDGSIDDLEGVVAAHIFDIPACDGLETANSTTFADLSTHFIRMRPSVTDELDFVITFLEANEWDDVAFLYSSLSSYADEPNFVQRASERNIYVSTHFEIMSDGVSCANALEAVRSTSVLTVVFFGDPDLIPICVNAARRLGMLPNDGYTWIINDDAVPGMFSNVGSDLDGMIVVVADEGVGPLYKEFLGKWADPVMRTRYPNITAFPSPPQGYMFSNTCLHVLVDGFHRLIQRSGLPESQALSLLNSGFYGFRPSVDKPNPNVELPPRTKLATTFEDPNLNTVTGPVSFKPGSADRIGNFTMYFTAQGNSLPIVTGCATDIQVNWTLLRDLTLLGRSSHIVEPRRVNTMAVIVGTSGAALLIGTTLLMLLLYRRLLNNRRLLNDASKKGNSRAKKDVLQIEGAGEKALNLIRRLQEDNRKGKFKRATATNEDFEFLLDAFIAGAQKYVPTFGNQAGDVQRFMMQAVIGTTSEPRGDRGEQDESIPPTPSGTSRRVRQSRSLAFPSTDISIAASTPMMQQYSTTSLADSTPFSDLPKKPFLTPPQLLNPSDLSSLDGDIIQDYLDLWYLSWNVDMFDFCVISGGHPLYFSALWIFEHMDLLSYFKIPKEEFGGWLLMIEAEYHPHPYHNSVHAADVLHALKFLAFGIDDVTEKFSPLEKFAGLVAAIGHDIDHPGFTNQFLIKIRHEYAILYSDTSVNENHHSAHLFRSTMGSQFNIFNNLSGEAYEEMRKIIIRLILCTDMSKHFEYLTKFKARIATNAAQKLETQENRLILMEMALKCGDLNNPSKAPPLAAKWVDSIMEEFYRQGDEERDRSLQISQFMDRFEPNVAKCQIGFIDVVVSPMFDVWAYYNHTDTRTRSLRHNIRKNRGHWAFVSQQTDKLRVSSTSRDNTASITGPGGSRSVSRSSTTPSKHVAEPSQGGSKIDIDHYTPPPLPAKFNPLGSQGLKGQVAVVEEEG